MVTTIITKTELNPVILIPINIFREKILSVTTAIDSPKERTILSMTFICLKKTNVQAKPGTKNTSMKPRAALIMGTLLRKGRAKAKISLIGDSQSTLYIPPSIFSLDSI